MINKPLYKFLFFSSIALVIASCSTNKLATQNADDVYFSDVEANKINYAVATNKDYVEGNTYLDQNGYDRNNDYYYDTYDDISRFNRLNWNWNNNFTWRDYYYNNNLFYDPFWGPTGWGTAGYLGFNNFYGNGWGFSLGYNSPFFSYNMPWYNTSYWNYYGSFYGNSPYWGIYSYYNPGYWGNYYGGYYGYPNYGGIYYGSPNSPRNLTPRPRGSYDNMRNGNNDRNIPIPNTRATRPGSTSTRPTTNSSGGTYNPYSRPSRPSGSSSDTRTNSQPASSGSSSRPVRPSSGGGGSDGGSQRSSQPSTQQSRPTRSESPSPSPRPSSSETSRSSSPSSSGSSGSSSGGGSSSSRPTRGGN